MTAQVKNIVVVDGDVAAVPDIADFDLEERQVERIDAGFEQAELQSLLAAVGHKVFGVQKFLRVAFRPGVGHDLASRQRVAVAGDNAAVETVGHHDHRQQVDAIENIEKN